jgi:hypothetical protein
MGKENNVCACIKAFKEKLRNNQCPFCGKKLEYYHGMLGYEALRCYSCNVELNRDGLNFMEDA